MATPACRCPDCGLSSTEMSLTTHNGPRTCRLTALRRNLEPGRIRGRERVLCQNQLVPPADEAAHVVHMIPVDRVAVEDERAGPQKF